MEVKNILVPIDFSKCSKNALKIAIKIAKKVGAKIHMVNAVHIHTPHPDFSGGSVIDGLIADYEAQVKQSFEELESEIIELKDVPHESDRFLSYLTDAIFAECDSKDIDLIIMGTRADHDKMEHLIGTHSTDVIESSDVPVLVIPEDVTEFELKKIGFASDFVKVSNVGNLKILKWIARLFNTEVLVFHVMEDPSKLTTKEERQIEVLKQKLEGINTSVLTVESSSIVDGIKDFVNEHNLDLMALLPRRHNLFQRIFKKSVTKTIAIDPQTPLLTFHDF